jgi:phage shock protein A
MILIHQLQQTILHHENHLAILTNENIQLKEKIEYLQRKISELIQEKIQFLKNMNSSSSLEKTI